MDVPLFNQINHNLAALAKVIEVCGVLLIVIGGLISISLYLKDHLAKRADAYEELRRSLGKSILLGLEVLVAGDIIGTVAVEPTFASLGVLALIVLIRTFLSFSLEVEIEGRWPWTRKRSE